ncbi:plexin-A2-like [Patiria miniata]|uniref:Sema domain-containing protein n=1 Tax=Patiria miniata TaxID=46514 RepID=A0A913ZSN9_PATMI|nr:plexin-A2-like [Patiria miniata]
MENNRSASKMAGCIQRLAQTVARCLLLWQLALTVVTLADRYPVFEEVYQPENNLIKLKNMLLDQNTSALYVGSVNHLYKLSPDLGIQATIETGPRQDNPGCIAPPVDCDYERTTTDNINKLLVIDQDRLFVCGSIYQGSCVIRRLSDLGLLGNDSYQEIAANTPDGTSVAFVAPGPLGTDVLYVGTSYGQWIDKAVPTVSSRVLPVENTGSDLFEILEDANNFLEAEIQIPSDFITNNGFNIDYLYGFSNTKFSYFVAVQPKDPEHIQPTFYTKIARICQQDIAYYSYIELPLSCKQGDTDYNVAQSAYVATIGSALASGSGFEVGEKVLFVTFSESRVDEIAPTESSAICMYSIKRINEQFNDRRKECASGVGTTDIPWLRSTQCPVSQNLVDRINAEGTEYCHDQDFIRPLGGNTPIAAQAIYTDNSILSAIAVTAHLDKTVIFLGDQLGHLKKLWVLSHSEAVLYEEEAILSGDQRPVVRNGIIFSPDKNFFYFMTERKIHKIPVEDCSAHTTCEDCLGVGNGVGDPYCGWCSLQKNCTRRSQTECAGSEDPSNLRWLGKLDQCIAILSVEPPNTPSTRAQELTLKTRGLPQLDPTTDFVYKCKFGNLPMQPTTVDFTTNTSSVRCLTPPSDQLPSTVQGFLRVELSIHATETSLDIVSTDFDFYDCSTFTSCMECVGNEYKCDWCIFQNKCIGNSSSCDPNGIVTKREGEPNGEMACPRIVNDGQEILIPVGVSKRFSVPVANLPLPKDDAGYKCVLEYEDSTQVAPANRVSETSLECQPKQYDYTTDENDLPVVLTVTWGSDYKIDNPDDLSVNLYKCDVKRPNCGDCLAGPDKYQCGWCHTIGSLTSGDVCSLESECGNTWLSGDALCPHATITDFSPKSGYIRGGTNLTITGTNLGQKVEDIRSVTVAGTNCAINEGYVVATQVVCSTQASSQRVGEIVIIIGSGNQTDSEEPVKATSEEPFSYVVPELSSMSPAFGPASGGTVVTLTGKHLDAGTDVITVIGGPACQLISRSLNELVCKTPSGSIGTFPVQMLFDGEPSDASLDFQYKQDPAISSLNRYKSIKSGGLEIKVVGTNLNVIQNPKIQFTINNETNITLACNIQTPTSMTCPSPDVSPYAVQAVPKAKYGFVLDGVQNFTTLKDVTVVQPFEFVPNPQYFKFEDGIKKLLLDQQTIILEIQGENLTLITYMEGDVNVTIGDAVCKDVTLITNRLTCYPPPTQPQSKTGTEFPEVVVYHGNLNFTIGQLEYVGEDFLVFILIGVGIFFIIVIIVFILCISYRKAFANDTIVRQMEAQRDQLELQVAQECKETFAELQTDMTILTGDLEAIPYREYHKYCIRTLFPDQPNHCVLKELALAGASKNQVEQGLVMFEQLVSNKQFLLTFIRSLEAQKGFTQKDKSNVASLIMVALQGKMDYSTSILKVLLKDLIEKHVEKDRARLLMRRNESVAEKMVSNWLSFLLYNFIREKAGEPLFKLFYGIKQQMEKGPVDAITGEARYGLSEVKVIRQQINYTVMTINAIGLSKDAGPVQVKVLDFDTISQVKEKILDALYKTTPYSHRPPREELDLEWKEEGRILQDDDCKTEGEWRRLNMLCNYPGIVDGATLALVPKQGFTMSIYSNSKHFAMPAANSPARSVTTPMLSPDVDINGTKLWHLVKPSDSDYHKSGDKVHKMMAEIYLPRLLTTKGVLQTFVDELFEMIFSVNHRGNTLPICIKYLFDLLDDQARHHNIQNQDVVHSWKSNSLPLRFWVNLIKNPDIIFDIYKSETVDACLSIIGQTLMDACSVSDHHLTKDSSSSRLLYAKDIPKYKQWVGRYFEDIKAMPAISDQDMSAMLSEHSHAHQYDFHTHTALNELYFYYAITYKKQIIEDLEENDYPNLAEKFSTLCDQLNNTV